ncbi:fimbria/pilus outer membrane usher protein [Trinickia terrae]|uniref:fimbria/pilus outer membrane usher protein n=1 Tax=Trinickia terrae TaxID=2571161 RepID=UPI001F0E15CB|nr:fimbria/pilus outer membrane usher protein [Trinickia terrae]
MAVAFFAYSLGAQAQQKLDFDPAFLELGGGQGAADLSMFATGNRLLPGRYLVDVEVNGELADKREIAFISDEPDATAHDAVPCLTRDMLAEWGVNVAAFPELAQAPADECVEIARTIPDAKVAFDSYRQLLQVSVPQAAMKRRARGWVDPSKWDQGIPAALLDYQLNAAQYAGSNYSNSPSRTSLYAGLRGGVNFGPWRLAYESSFLRGLNGASQFELIDTYLTRDIVSWNSRLTVGDGTTPSSIFDGFQFRGVQLGTDESMLPDSLQGYAPTIHGVAQTNAQVTVRQNGYVIYNTFVPPGPFTIDDLYPTSSSGDMEVTITEADGRVTKFIQPYAAVPLLLRAGSWRYNVTAGQYRDGIANTHPTFGMATLAHGLPGEFSLYGGVIGTDMYQAALAGIGKNLGRFGAVSFDVTHARSETNLADTNVVTGNSFRFLYAKTFAGSGTDVRVLGYRYSTSGYRSFADAVQLRDGTESLALGAKRARVEGTINQRLGGFGSVYATIGTQSYWNGGGTSELFQVGYTGQAARVSYGVYGTYNKGNGVPTSWNVSLSLSVPLDVLFGRGNLPGGGNSQGVTYFASRDNENRLNQQATLSGTAGDNQQFNYSLSAAHSNESSASGTATASYLAPFGRYDLSVASGSGYTQAAVTAAGGVVVHGGGVTFSQPLGETVGLVEVPGVRGVRFETNPGVATDGAGYAVIPYLNPYRINRVTVRTRGLPEDVSLDNPVLEIVPTRGAVAAGTFESKVGHQAMLMLKGPDGKPVPMGAMVENDEGQELGVVGMDGAAFVSGLPALTGQVVVHWGAEREHACHITYSLPPVKSNGDAYPQIEGTCQP